MKCMFSGNEISPKGHSGGTVTCKESGASYDGRGNLVGRPSAKFFDPKKAAPVGEKAAEATKDKRKAYGYALRAALNHGLVHKGGSTGYELHLSTGRKGARKTRELTEIEVELLGVEAPEIQPDETDEQDE